MSNDLRQAFRRLRRAPLFTAFAIATLAVAIGITTAVYSILRAGLQPETGVVNGDRFVMLGDAGLRASKGATPISWPDMVDIAGHVSSVRELALWIPFRSALFARESSEIIKGEAVSGAYFGGVGIAPLRGRLIDDSDDRPDAVPVAVISAAAWQARFGGLPGAIGESIKVGGRPFQIIGIAPASFRGISRQSGFGRTDVWVPLSSSGSGIIIGPFWDRARASRSFPLVSIGGRLKDGQSAETATSEFQLLARRIDEVTPLPERNSGGNKPVRRWVAVTAAERVDLTDVKDTARAMLLIPALVLLVACTNVANFALSRGMARQHELTVRKAIGASRWQLMRGQLTEYGLVTIAAAGGGIGIAAALLHWVAATVASLSGGAPEFRLETRIDAGILGAVGVSAVLAFLVAALLPAMRLTGKSLRQHLSSDQAAGAVSRWRGRSNLIALQISVSVALLLVTALCIRQLPKAHRTPSGLATDRLALVQIPFAEQAANGARARLTINRLMDDVRGRPGVASITASTSRRSGDHVELASDSRPFPPRRGSGPTARITSVAPDYFSSVGLSLVAGRPIDARDAAGGSAVVVIDESTARTLFGTADAVDRTIQVRDYGVSDRPDRLFTIVGVARDVLSPRSEVEHAFYVPLTQRFEERSAIDLLARVAPGADPERLAIEMRQSLRAIDPEIAVTQVGRADTFEFGPEIALQYFSLVFGGLAAIALGFAASGLYGVLSHVVAGRTRELGVRAALGADRRRLIRLIMRDGLRPVVEGIVIGFGLAAGARVGMQPWFEEPVTAVDPVALVIAVIPLFAAAGLACYLPARRAARVDPNVALRHL